MGFGGLGVLNDLRWLFFKEVGRLPGCVKVASHKGQHPQNQATNGNDARQHGNGQYLGEANLGMAPWLGAAAALWGKVPCPDLPPRKYIVGGLELYKL